jgi:DNA-directed RNA polymerase subunit RPC12/RpoP
MFHQNLKTMNMLCVCPECKNTIDLSRYPNLTAGMVIECNHCGMTLVVKNIAADGAVKTEIVDEGK